MADMNVGMQTGTVSEPDVWINQGTESSVELPTGVVFGAMDMSRDGADLLIEAADGRTILVENYFDAEPQADLVGVNGEIIQGNVVTALAGADTSGAAPADMTPVELTPEPIGQVNTMSGEVYVVRADGVRVNAALDMQLFQGDVLETLGDGAIGVVLVDETSFAMAEDGVMVLDELIYDPAEQEGSMSLFMLRGLATLTSGMVSKTDPNGMVIDTPVGTVGIRGTQIGIDATEGNTIRLIMMEEADGYVGEVTFTTPTGVIVMNQAYQVIGAAAGGTPDFLPSVNAGSVATMFGHALVHLPTVHGAANDYSTQEPEGGGELEGEPEADVVPEVEEQPEPETVEEVEAEAPPPVTQVVTEEAEALEAVEPVVPDADEESGGYEPVAEADVAPPPITERPEAVVPETPEVPDIGLDLNNPPVAFSETVTVHEDEPLSGQLSAVDADADALSFALATDGDPANGSITLNEDGSYVYTPDADFSGTDEFTYAVSDGKGGVTQSSVSIQVLPVAATPNLTVEDITLTGTTVPGDEIEGTQRDDELLGTAGDDEIEGKAGDDIIIGDAGVIGAIPPIPIDIQANLEEGEQIENLEISLQGVPEGATLSAGTDQGDGVWSLTPDDLDGLTMTLPEDHMGDFSLAVEAIHTDSNAELGVTDTATSSAVINVAINVEGGDDEINAGAGDDIVDAGGGDDEVRGGSGDDVLHGGEGDDEIEGGQGDDVVFGGAGDDEIEGGRGADVLRGGAGDDEIEGGRGDDYLYGGAGDDVLEGGQGADVLRGGTGDDVFYGGKGFDEFIFSLDAGEDVIADYKLGELIRFEGPEFSDAEPVISSNDDGGVSIAFGDHNVEVTVDNVDLSQQSYTITPSDDGLVVVFDDLEG